MAQHLKNSFDKWQVWHAKYRVIHNFSKSFLANYTMKAKQNSPKIWVPILVNSFLVKKEITLLRKCEVIKRPFEVNHQVKNWNHPSLFLRAKIIIPSLTASTFRRRGIGWWKKGLSVAEAVSPHCQRDTWGILFGRLLLENSPEDRANRILRLTGPFPTQIQAGKELQFTLILRWETRAEYDIKSQFSRKKSRDFFVCENIFLDKKVACVGS